MAIINVDWRFIEIEYELWALGHLLGVLEQQVEFLRAQDELKTFAELKERGWDHDEAERQLASQELRDRQDYVIPRFLRGPFVVSLWACYESAVREVAEYYQRIRKVELGVRDVRADNELKLFVKYFQAVLGEPLDTMPSRLAIIEDLRVVRNAIAHANGQRRAMSDDKWTAVTQALSRRGVQPDEDRGLIVLNAQFLQQAFDTVNDSLRELVSRARSV
jgi:hypothetical protein